MNHQENIRAKGFSLIELLVAISIIALLIGILLPVLAGAKREARRISCASNVRQINTATFAYVADYRQTLYWRGNNPAFDGMDWYVYGGRSVGNQYTGPQGNFFNQFDPRPLNSYVGDNIEVFHCPHDEGQYDWSGDFSHFDWVGNSYTFNAIGHPTTNSPADGLAGRKLDQVRETTLTPLYLDTTLHKAPGHWHGENGNIAFADGHVEFGTITTDPADTEYVWSVR